MQITIMSNKVRARKKRPSRGFVLIMFLVCLAVAAALIAGTAKIAISSHRATQNASCSAQARWLAESGVERAAASLAIDAEYKGETWNIPASEIGGPDAGVVRIKVLPVADQPTRRTIEVEADFPDDPVYCSRQTKEIILDLP
jgi:Tfp pilus assembly protein PilV